LRRLSPGRQNNGRLNILGDRIAMSRLSQLLRASRRRLRPATLEGFDPTIGLKDLAEGCRRFGVEPAGAVVTGLLRRSLGVEAVGPDGSRSWVKVSALRGVASHPNRDAELGSAAIRGVSKPALLASRQWAQRDRP
jgi:hypothetical protein